MVVKMCGSLFLFALHKPCGQEHRCPFVEPVASEQSVGNGHSSANVANPALLESGVAVGLPQGFYAFSDVFSLGL